MSPHRSEQRPVAIPLGEFLNAFNANMATKTQNSESSPVNKIRAEFLFQCRQAAKKSPGIFTLTVPAGGGKTLSSLAFALKHAVLYKKRRIIYAIPYTSIIEQTATVFKEIVAPLDNSILEHHSNVEPDKESQENAKSRLATENWDAPIVVTTTVQFFESLFAARTSRCRKLHNIANSVVVLDEIQLLPLQHLAPIRKIMALLAEHYGVTFILSTATPTGLDEQNNPFGKKLLEGLSSTEIVRNPNEYYSQLKRVHYKLPKDLFELMLESMPSGTYHLSALMWKVALSRTNTTPGGSLGSKSYLIQRLKRSAPTLAVVRLVVSKTPARSAPMTLVRPFACQLCLPKQRWPRGA